MSVGVACAWMNSVRLAVGKWIVDCQLWCLPDTLRVSCAGVGCRRCLLDTCCRSCQSVSGARGPLLLAHARLARVSAATTETRTVEGASSPCPPTSRVTKAEGAPTTRCAALRPRASTSLDRARRRAGGARRKLRACAGCLLRSCSAPHTRARARALRVFVNI